MSHQPPTVASADTDRDTITAGEIKALLAKGDTARARERFEELVGSHQRRAARIAYHYLRDVAEVDEAVQDAFVKAFVHLPSFRQELPFVVWFTRIVINGCLDRLKAQNRRSRWMVPVFDSGESDRDLAERRPSAGPTPEEAVQARERREHLAAAIQRLPERQRTVLILGVFEGYTAREISEVTGVNESTVRVHQFRAIRALRKLIGGDRWLIERGADRTEASRT
ncbi:MAG: sigma-70 family RNA polymerase sigma factor [Vicinamibacterales bacterium]|jgi:RNA polymerase sigma-70 factor (ECF subfamily)|nr:hypothetical protein [Acidobacteriota bacterium]MDP6373919.1 sigma-70 family RNA polymerase sigma factor [Vicinamibacterales bacterium]MDP6608351.1 sigma-70 family RNA polymerase sigma factor [Vicinamibacterales bacterium]HAK55591.1 hypothetical protein [Acidobacteriota bacterium]|tara:strand:+ start:861 stop:1535 length:675 start_codon:yes stop_codon:yes gene_type:complete